MLAAVANRLKAINGSVAPPPPGPAEPPPLAGALPELAALGAGPSFGVGGGFSPAGSPGGLVPGMAPAFTPALTSTPPPYVGGFGQSSPFGQAARGALGQAGQAIGQAADALGKGFGGGGIGRATGEYAVLNQYDRAFQQAADKFGIPANVLKAIAMNERGWEGTSPSGAVGIMQVMPQYWGDAGYDLYDPTGNIMAGALAFKSFYDQYKDEAVARGVDPYVAAAGAYLAGNPWSTASDYYGSTASSYGQAFQQHLNELGGMGGGTTGGGSAQGAPGGGGGWQSAFQGMFGTSAVPDWGEFNTPSSNGLYGYGTEYGLNGVNHTGIDVPMNPGSPMRAAFSGHVVCAGTGWGTGEDSCGAFNCAGYCPDGAAGRIEIMSDDGNTVLIYGHSSGSSVKPGQRVTAGTVLGTSGGQNSGHVHLEARVRDASTPSGWRIVDPRTVVGGGLSGAIGGAGQAIGQAAGGLVAPGGPLFGGRSPVEEMARRMGWL